MQMLSYTMLSRLKIIKACKETITSIDNTRNKMRAEVIENIMKRKYWFCRSSSYEEAVEIYEDSCFDNNFKVYLDKLSAEGYCDGQRIACKDMLNLCLASNEELIAVTVDDFYWISNRYE